MDQEGCTMSRPNDEGADARNANPSKAYQNPQQDFAADGSENKALATMQARAVLCGCTLRGLANGKYRVGKWNYSKAVPSLRAVGDMLRRIGGGR
jgi:hypothetical protein